MKHQLLELIPAEIYNLLRSKFMALPENRFLVSLEETLRFIELASHGGRMFLHGNKEIDEIWHELILETRFYKSLNEQLNPQGFVHHTAISYKDYSASLSADELHSEELSFLASYIHNYGPFTEERVGFWSTCADIMRRMDWTLSDLNKFGIELVEQTLAASNEYGSPIHRQMSEQVCSGLPMSAEDLILYMDDYGERNPFACRFFSKMLNSENKNYYQLVAEIAESSVPKSVTPVILDIACGEGIGLSAFRGSAELFGIDISAYDLKEAEKRLAGKKFQLVNATAQDMPFAERTFDFACCNMALMLMHPLEKVLNEVSRVLKPGAIFVSVIPSAQPQNSEVTQKFVELNNRLAKEYLPNFPYLGFGPGHLKSASSIESIFKKEFDPECRVNLTDHVFTALVLPDEAAEFTSSMYWTDLLPHSKRKSVRNSFFRFFEHHKNKDGLVRIERTLTFISAIKTENKQWKHKKHDFQ